MFKVYLLVSCICVVVAILLYFFYWNRFIALLLSWAFRISYWNQGGSSIWIEIGSIHISFIAGRILFKDVRYYSSNETIKIVKAQIIWKYWLRKPATEEDLQHVQAEGEDFKQASHLPSCRIKLSAQGFEWFFYNRTAAYDHIISILQGDIDAQSMPRTATPKMNTETSKVSTHRLSCLLQTVQKIKHVFFLTFDWIRRQMPYLDRKDLLPVSLDIMKGAVICGNFSTPNLLVIEFQRVCGVYGTVSSRSQYDLYKQTLDLKIENTVVRLVENDDFQGQMSATGHLVHERMGYSMVFQDHAYSYLSFYGFSKFLKYIKVSSLMSKSRPASSRRSHGPINSLMSSRKLHQSIDEETPVGMDFINMEYAVERKILEAPLLELFYYADVVGYVPDVQNQSGNVDLDSFDIGNGDVPPEWGLDLIVRNGILRYGPWADRQRVHLQKTFFPPIYRSMLPTERLKPGDRRAWTAFKVFIELREETTLVIPFREASKNWQWDGECDVPRPRKREAAAIHVNAGDSSTINYVLPMITGPSGYEARMEVHLDSVIMTSSLNDMRLLVAESCRVGSAMPSPLWWNSQREWSFAISLHQPVLYLLRDHINMFTDLAKDWASGPPVEFQQFIPMTYSFDFQLHHFEVNLYANDQNVIDKPLVREDNVLFTLRGSRWQTKATVPSDGYKPNFTTIPFIINLPDISVSASLPRWNAQSLYASHRVHNFLHASVLRLDATYTFFSEVRPENIDQLKLNISAYDVAYKALGWSVRYFMVLRDNYFGSFQHFSTLNEYLGNLSKQHMVGDPIEKKYRPGKSNMLQVEMPTILRNVRILLPAGLPGHESPDCAQNCPDGGFGACVALAVPELQFAFRLHDYSMDMSLNTTAISGCVLNNHSDELLLLSHNIQNVKEMFLIDGIDLTAHRLFGPQPRTSTYVCIWEISFGHVRAVMPAFDWRVLAAAVSTFRLNYSDLPNAPAAQYGLPVVPDATFVKVSIAALNVTWLAKPAAAELCLPRGLTLHTNDLAGQYYRKITSLRLPHASVKLLHTSGSSQKMWSEAAALSLDLNLDMYTAPSGWQNSAKVQAEFIRAQDRPTQRAAHIFAHMMDAGSHFQLRRTAHQDALFLPLPRLPSQIEQSSVPRTERGDKKVPVRWSRMSHLSESEEENVSEADRDARLARTRQVTLTSDHLEENDQSMSGADESDDEGLTGESSSDSENSWIGDKRPLMLQYHDVIRHYSENCLLMPSQWDDSPFLLIKDVKPIFPHQNIGGGSHFGAQNRHVGRDIAKHPDNNLSMTSIRVECNDGIKANVNSLLVQVAKVLSEDLQRSNLSDELILDGMMSNYLSSFTKSQSDRERYIIDCQLATFSLQIAEHITLAENSLVIPPGVEGRAQSKQNLAVIGLHTTECIVSAEFVRNNTTSSGSWTSQIAVDEMRLALASRPSEVSHPLKRVPSSYSLRHLRAQIAQGFASLVLARTSLELGSMDLEFLAATGTALLQDAKKLSSIYIGWYKHAAFVIQRIVYRRLLLAQDKSVVDPLSTIQPSYLVQDGQPQQIRMDATFKFLFHIRNSNFSKVVEGDASSLLDQRDVGEQLSMSIGPLLQSFLRSLVLEADAFDVAQRSIMEILCPGTHNSLAERGQIHPIKSIVVLVDSLSLLLRDASNQAPSHFDIASLKMQYLTSTLVPLSVPTFLAFSQSSFREASRESISRDLIQLSADEIDWTIQPQLINFAHHLLDLHEVYARRRGLVNSGADAERGHEATQKSSRSLIVTVGLRKLRIQAIAESLILVLGGSNIDFSSSSLEDCDFSQNEVHSSNHSLIFTTIFFEARSKLLAGQTSQDLLASMVLTAGKFNAVQRHQKSSPDLLRVATGLQGIQFTVPRSAIRLHRFIEGWKAEYLPDMYAMIQSLHSRRGKMSKMEQMSLSSLQTLMFDHHVHLSVESLGISLQVMHGTWLAWHLNDIFAFTESDRRSSAELGQLFGLRTTSQTLSISSRSQKSDESKPPIKLTFPTTSVAGRYGQNFVDIEAALEFLTVLIKPSYWHTVLAVQQKFSQDLTDLMDLIEQSRDRSVSSAEPKIETATAWPWNARFRMKGFKIGLEGLSSTVFLECNDISGVVNRGLEYTWKLTLTDLALSLASRSGATSKESRFNRSHRTAFVIIDFRAHTGSHSKGQGAHDLFIILPKIHAVMQPSSIGEVGDFVDNLEAEMLFKREQRVSDHAAFKEKTRTVFKTFEITTRDTEENSWLNEYTINVTVENVGVAFPLNPERDLEMPRTSTHDSMAVRAFLFSVRSIRFGAQRGETGQMTITDFSFQFISRFRQSVFTDFAGCNHHTHNRLMYPEMAAQLRSGSSATSRTVWISANVSGFILDVDSSITDYVFLLFDVYRQGKERMTKFGGVLPHNFASQESQHPPEMEGNRPTVPAVSIFASLIFYSGEIRVHSRRGSTRSRLKSRSDVSFEGELSDSGADIMRVPVVSVWGEYRAITASLHKAAFQTNEPSILMFKSTIHSSQNSLKPTLLPFISEVVDHVQMRMRKVSRFHPDTISSTTLDDVLDASIPLASNRVGQIADLSSTLQISLSLRIDKSKLELTCQPDVNVIAALQWDSGGFVVNISPGAHKVTFTGSVDGLTAGLKHGFLSDDCVNLEARNLAFSMTFAKNEYGGGNLNSSMSLVLSTDLSGGVRFSRLQDVLCFKAVWLDRIPVFTDEQDVNTRLQPKVLTSKSSSNDLAAHQKITTAILIRIRHIKLEVDLGQSITNVILGLENAQVRTKLTETSSEVSLSVAQVAIIAKGNVSGRIDVPDCVFQTIRRHEDNNLDNRKTTKMLELNMTSGPFFVELESDHQKLLVYRAEPLKVDIHDDWSSMSSHARGKDRPLLLSFSVSGTEVVFVATVGTLPKLMSYAKKFQANLDAQREGASRESAAFRVTRSPKPDNPLSEVANAMLQSARNRFKEAGIDLGYVIRQKMSFQLDSLRLIIFPRTMADLEIAHFIGRDVQAKLNRVVASNGIPSWREVHLSFTNMTISKFSQLGHLLSMGKPPPDDKAWLDSLLRNTTEAIIVGLPSMDIDMVTELTSQDSKTELEYDFQSDFVKRKGGKALEDIYITLNVSLYSWLTLLRKNLTREMEQVQATVDWKTTPAGVVPVPTSRKPVTLLESPKETLVDSSAKPASIPEPGARLASVIGTKGSVSSSRMESSNLLFDAFGKDASAESTSRINRSSVSPVPGSEPDTAMTVPPQAPGKRTTSIIYKPRSRHIGRLTMRQLGEATPDVMHPFFMKKAGFNLEDSLPQYVHEYATIPLEEIMEALLKLYSKQLRIREPDRLDED